ncbi:MAG: hypothetical protein H0U52_17060 [Chloroflexi bacterium]|nr:hypothetical protein [Chloroflexota bacterium]
MRTSAGSFAVVVWLAALALAIIASPAIVLALVAFLALFLIPGWLLTTRLLPDSIHGGASRAAASIGLGISFAILAGVILELTPLGIAAAPWLLLAVALGGGLQLALRFSRTRPRVARFGGVSTGQVALLGVSVLLAVGALGLSRVSVVTRAPAELTQLWLLPQSDGSIRLGVANYGRAGQDYRLVLQSPAGAVRDWPAIRLEPGQVWEETLSERPAGRGELRGILYRLEEPAEPYREVVLAAKPEG